MSPITFPSRDRHNPTAFRVPAHGFCGLAVAVSLFLGLASNLQAQPATNPLTPAPLSYQASVSPEWRLDKT